MVERSASKNGHSNWLCICSCGSNKTVLSNQLLSGKSKSCGCLRSQLMKAKAVERFTKHGKYKTKEFKAWINMKNRCYLKSDVNYKNYGDRGIGVCERWVDSFDNFLTDMGVAPTKKHTLERLNVNLGYSKQNCIWASYTIQANNRRSNVIIRYKGVNKTVADWARSFGVKPNIFYKRIKNCSPLGPLFKKLELKNRGDCSPL